MLASHIRRRDEWAFQSNQTLKELQQIDKQVLASEIRIAIASKERDNHLQQIEQAQAVDEVMRTKFSNAQLYDWMVSQLSMVHFGAYRLALDLARRAERAAARELGSEPLNIIRNDYWDSLRSGLLAGDRLVQDIKRLEIEFLNRNVRELEITRHISLRQLDPEQLLMLRTKDECEFTLPEWLFDIDFPGHYFRRIKTVGVSLPCVVGPYTSVSGTLTLKKSEVRHQADRAADEEADANFKTVSYMPMQSIATSTAQNDSGLFELNFRDERYLPFEGAGAESTWKFTLPGSDFVAFDYATISDFVLHVRYTARDGGESFRDEAIAAVKVQAVLGSGFTQLLSLKQDFARELAARATGPSLSLKITEDMRPYVCRKGFVLVRAELWKLTFPAEMRRTQQFDSASNTVTVNADDADPALDPHLVLRFRLPAT